MEACAVVAPSTEQRRKPNSAEARRRVLRRVYPRAPERPRFLETRLLRAGEVAALLQVSRRSVAAWAVRGLIPYIETPGGHRRFRASDVRTLVSSLKCAVELDVLPALPEPVPRSRLRGTRGTLGHVPEELPVIADRGPRQPER